MYYIFEKRSVSVGSPDSEESGGGSSTLFSRCDSRLPTLMARNDRIEFE